MLLLPLAAMLAAGAVVTVKLAALMPSMVTPVMLSALLALLLRMTKVFDTLLPALMLS